MLLELDLRKPDRDKPGKGLAEYLQGNIDVKDLMNEATCTGNLSIVSAGHLSPNPSELLGNGRLEQLLSFLQIHFDYIVIDSSPVIPVTDAYLLSPLCDITLFIIRQGVTPVSVMSSLNERFLTKRLKNVAVVFNGIKDKGLNKYYYGYAYDYKNRNEHKTKRFNKSRLN